MSRAFNPHRGSLLPAIGGGLAGGFIFVVSLSIDSTGIIFASLPMLLPGLALGARAAMLTSLTACLGVTALMMSPAGGLIFAGAIGFPVYYFVRQALLWREAGGTREWYPVLRLLSELTIILAFIFMLMAMATRSQGGLEAMVPHNLGDTLKSADPDFVMMMQHLTNDDGFLILALIAWVWLAMLYGMAVLANTALKARALRPSLALGLRGIPVSMLWLLGLIGLLAVFGDKVDQFTADTVLLILLMPYCLSGLALVHLFSIRRGVPYRILWLMCFYTVLAVFFLWVAPILIAAGLYLQLSEMLDRRNKIG